MPKLTVAIPTYKRPLFLKRCIDSVLTSVGQRDVEVLICDDSTDGSNDGVYASLPDRTGVRILRNTQNLGIDANICRCIEQAHGDFVWLIGEDDLMRRSGVEVVLQKIASMPQAPFIYVNYSYITSDQLFELRHRSIEDARPELPFSEFVDKHLWSAGFIGGCVIQRREFLKTRYRDFIGTYYAHVAGLTLASLGKTIGLVRSPQVGNRVGDAATFTWSGDSFGVFQGWRVLLNRLEVAIGTTHYQRAYHSHVEAHGYLGYKFLIAKKADDLLTSTNLDMLHRADTSEEEKARIRFVARYVPAAVGRIARYVWAALRRQRLAPFSLE